MISKADSDGSGTIDFEEFMMMFTKVRPGRYSAPRSRKRLSTFQLNLESDDDDDDSDDDSDDESEEGEEV